MRRDRAARRRWAASYTLSLLLHAAVLAVFVFLAVDFVDSSTEIVGLPQIALERPEHAVAPPPRVEPLSGSVTPEPRSPSATAATGAGFRATPFARRLLATAAIPVRAPTQAPRRGLPLSEPEIARSVASAPPQGKHAPKVAPSLAPPAANVRDMETSAPVAPVGPPIASPIAQPVPMSTGSSEPAAPATGQTALTRAPDSPQPSPSSVPSAALVAQRTAPAATAPPAQTAAPTPAAAPPRISSAAPTQAPTAVPTREPTAAPTAAPAREPTAAPTVAPTQVPTQVPTAAPTQLPSAAPSRVETPAPTAPATAPPLVSRLPSAAPTAPSTRSPVGSAAVDSKRVATAAPARSQTASSVAPRRTGPIPVSGASAAPTMAQSSRERMGGPPIPRPKQQPARNAGDATASLNARLKSLTIDGDVDYRPKRVATGDAQGVYDAAMLAYEQRFAPPVDILRRTFGVIYRRRSTAAPDSVAYVYDTYSIGPITMCKAWRILEHPYRAIREVGAVGGSAGIGGAVVKPGNSPDVRHADDGDPEIGMVQFPCTPKSYTAVKPGSLGTPLPLHPDLMTPSPAASLAP